MTKMFSMSAEKLAGNTGGTCTITDLQDAIANVGWDCYFNQSTDKLEVRAASTGTVPQGLSERERTLHGLVAGVEDGLYLVARGLEKLDEAMPSSEEDAVATEKWGALEKSFQEMWEYLEERLELELCEQLIIQDEDNDCIPNGGE